MLVPHGLNTWMRNSEWFPSGHEFIGDTSQGILIALYTHEAFKLLRSHICRCPALRACLKIETGTISSSEKRGKIDKELQRIPSCRDDCVRTLGSDYRQQEAVCFSKASFL